MSTLNDFLARMTVSEWKPLLALFSDSPRVTRKDDFVAAILRGVSGTGLRALWDRLDELQRLAVAEAAYDPEGIFDERKFEAKFGRLPEFIVEQRRAFSSRTAPTPLNLFLYYEDRSYRLPADIRSRLKDFVPEPEPVRLKTIDALPERIGGQLLVMRHTERDAIIDLSVLLRLSDQGKIQVSEKTSLPSASTVHLVTEKLSTGDFYPDEPKRDRFEQEIGPIKAFAWPLLLQSAGYLRRDGGKLTLSPAGLKALSAAPAASLRTLWRRWLKSDLLDEFSRIDEIKGQRSKGRVMTAVPPRRATIDTALRCCPVGKWISVDELSRFMRATDCLFEVTHDPWKLYIVEQQYGNSGYGGSHDWSILQLRYLLCFLFEYAATLGITDVAYVRPAGARGDYGHMWGADDLDFLSRYDGLMFVRLTPLGAYCLGLSPEYAPSAVQPNVRLSVLPGLQVNVVEGRLAAEESLLLDTWAIQTTSASWQLDRQKALAAVEKGHDASELLTFLQSRDDQPLPISVESFIKTSKKQGRALKIAGTALLIECQDSETAAAISSHKETAGLCLRAGDRYLVVRLEHEDKFRTLIRVLGFGMTA